MIALAVESGWAIAGGLIPIVGALAVFLIIFQAVREPPDDDEEDGGEE